MDEALRALEREANDPVAMIRLQAAWGRLGLGWFGEEMPNGLKEEHND